MEWSPIGFVESFFYEGYEGKSYALCMYVLFLWSCFPAHEFIFTAKTQTGRPFSPSCPGKFPLEWLFGFVP